MFKTLVGILRGYMRLISACSSNSNKKNYNKHNNF